MSVLVGSTLPGFAYGGAGAGASGASLDVTTVDVASAGEHFEAVLQAHRDGGRVTVWIADLDTSAPIDDAAATLALSCTTSGTSNALTLDLHPGGAPGVWVSAVPLPPGASCSGALSISGGSTSDLLEITAFSLSSVPHGSTSPTPRASVYAITTVAVTGALLLGLVLGVLLGRRGRLLSGVVAFLTVAGLSARAWSHGGEDHGAPSPLPTGLGGAIEVRMASQFLLEIRTERVRAQDFIERVEAFGFLEAAAGEGAELSAPVSGVLMAPDGGGPRPGQSVVAGQVLAALREGQGAADRVGTASAQADARVRLAEARSTLALAERDAASAESLAGVISARERTVRSEALAVAQEAVRRHAAAVEQAGDGVVAFVRSPMDGQIAAITAHPGDSVDAGQTLFAVVGAGALQVAARLPEALGGGLLPGAEALVRPAAWPDLLFAASLVDPGQLVDPSTGMLPLTLQLAAADPRLKPGMSARVWVTVGAPRTAVVVPDQAVVESGGQPLVFVKTGPETFEVRPVRTGHRDGDRVEVLTGLRAGERVVVAGTYVLRSLAGR